ncbi:DUF397 domain-containing protein [Streptosporangium sp. NPDC003464]
MSDNSGNCVEVAPTRGGGRAVRDSKDQPCARRTC